MLGDMEVMTKVELVDLLEPASSSRLKPHAREANDNVCQ